MSSFMYKNRYLPPLPVGNFINDKDEQGHTLLHKIAIEGKNHAKAEKLAVYLLENGGNPNEPDEDIRTPLHYAVLGKNHEILELLLMYGANPDSVDEFQMTPLHIAASAGDNESVEKLLEYGADYYIRDDLERTVLELAFDKGHLETVDLLRRYGARC